MEYTFKVKKKTFVNTNMLEGLINEVRKEKSELSFTHKVNEKTTKLHAKVLREFRTDLNKILKKIDVRIDLVEIDECHGSNRYHVSTFDIHLAESSFFVKISGISSSDVNVSRYTTYTGDYMLLIKEGTRENNYSKSRSKKIESIDDAITFMSNSIKKHIAINNHY